MRRAELVLIVLLVDEEREEFTLNRSTDLGEVPLALIRVLRRLS